MPAGSRRRSQTPLPGTTVSTCRLPSGSAATAVPETVALPSIRAALASHVPDGPRTRSQTVPRRLRSSTP
ncbi:hypothetical protein FAF44_38910 [Nonomuraea sp. MG754425]|nr:hypothetical protein [Nonomuraea sp. MG754425]